MAMTMSELGRDLNSKLILNKYTTKSQRHYERLIKNEAGPSKEFALQLSEITGYEITDFLFPKKQNNVWKKLLNKEN